MFAAKIDIATRTVQRWEKGEQVPDSNYLMRIAKVTGVVAHWLLTGEGDMLASDTAETRKYYRCRQAGIKKWDSFRFRCFASVPGGAPSQMFHSEHVERLLTVDDVRDPNAFALEVKGNSMAPRIENGDIIVVSPRHECEKW